MTTAFGSAASKVTTNKSCSLRLCELAAAPASRSFPLQMNSQQAPRVVAENKSVWSPKRYSTAPSAQLLWELHLAAPRK